MAAMHLINSLTQRLLSLLQPSQVAEVKEDPSLRQRLINVPIIRRRVNM
jgi:hypothetical protein